MGVSTQSAMALMADALDLRHRLPRLWAQVEDLAVAPWKTRRVADDTRSLPYEAARWVDEELAARVDGFGTPDHRAAGRAGAARFAPEEQVEKETGREPQHARHSHRTRARVTSPARPTSRPPVTPQDLTAFYPLVCDGGQAARPAR